MRNTGTPSNYSALLRVLNNVWVTDQGASLLTKSTCAYVPTPGIRMGKESQAKLGGGSHDWSGGRRYCKECHCRRPLEPLSSIPHIPVSQGFEPDLTIGNRIKL